MSKTLKLLRQKSVGRKSGTVPPGMLNLLPKRNVSRLQKLLAVAGGLFVVTAVVWGYILFDTLTEEPLPVKRRMPRQQVATKTLPEKSVPSVPAEQEPDEPMTVAEVLTASREAEESLVKAVPQSEEQEEEETAMVEPVTTAEEREVERQVELARQDPPQEAPKPRPDDPMLLNSYLARGADAYRRRDYSTAREMYEKVIRYRVNGAVVNNLLAIYAKSGDVRRAEQLMMRHEKLVDETVLAGLLLEMSSEGLTAQAGAFYGKAKGFDRTGAILSAGGYLAESAADTETAGKRYAEAYRKNDRDLNIAYMYARWLDGAGEYTEALALYRKAATLAGDAATKTRARERARQLADYLQ